MTEHYIFKTNDDKYLVSKIIEYNGHIMSKIIATCESLAEAQMIKEDGVPGNAVSSGNVSPGDGEEPPVPMAGSSKRKKRRKEILQLLHRRMAPMLRT